MQKILDRSAFSGELRVGKNLIVDPLAFVGQNPFDGCFDCTLPVSEVSSCASTEALGFGWSVDGDEHNISLCHMLLHIGAEEEVLASALFNHIFQARVIDQKPITIPCIDPRNRDVNSNGTKQTLSLKKMEAVFLQI
ncbi:hypothetical protein Nepgr_032054 [Nepenthes gracilis]|uniref:Uncharacterized protein n=1 Tax=Nepenthes gracilis TaxID=150966 RepID=A0AAD3Y805_NEPGR|nr:hypothetical protein Nepgr_032054 [Nepenthes gracilis]